MRNNLDALYRLQDELRRLEEAASKAGERELALFIGVAAMFTKDRIAAESRKRPN